MYVRLLFLLVFLSQTIFAQTLEGGGALPVPSHSNDREFIETVLKRARINSEKLKAAKGPVLEADRQLFTFSAGIQGFIIQQTS